MKFLSLILFVLLSLQAVSQEGEFNPAAHGTFAGFPAGSQLTYLINPYWLREAAIDGADINPYPDIKGTSFFKSGWDKGYILFSDNVVVKNDSISFNVYSNEIYFLVNNKAMILNTSVPAVQFGFAIEGRFKLFYCFSLWVPGN